MVLLILTLRLQSMLEDPVTGNVQKKYRFGSQTHTMFLKTTAQVQMTSYIIYISHTYCTAGPEHFRNEHLCAHSFLISLFLEEVLRIREPDSIVSEEREGWAKGRFGRRCRKSGVWVLR
jgi:hypothetical protein